MGTITINGRKVEFTNEKNILTIPDIKRSTAA